MQFAQKNTCVLQGIAPKNIQEEIGSLKESGFFYLPSINYFGFLINTITQKITIPSSRKNEFKQFLNSQNEIDLIKLISDLKLTTTVIKEYGKIQGLSWQEWKKLLSQASHIYENVFLNPKHRRLQMLKSRRHMDYILDSYSDDQIKREGFRVNDFIQFKHKKTKKFFSSNQEEWQNKGSAYNMFCSTSEQNMKWLPLFNKVWIKLRSIVGFEKMIFPYEDKENHKILAKNQHQIIKNGTIDNFYRELGLDPIDKNVAFKIKDYYIKLLKENKLGDPKKMYHPWNQ